MSEFKKYANKLLKKTELNRLEKDDLENELVEHLNNMKDDYIKEGMSEKDSIDMTIKNFNQSNFIKEINNFALNKKLTGINISYLLKINILLILIYLILMIATFSLFRTNQDSTVLYFLTICFILFVNYNYAISHFELKKDIISNISITCIIFFLIEKIGIVILSKIYCVLSNNLEFNNIFDLYVFDLKKILIYLATSIIVILISIYHNPNSTKRNFKLSTMDISILFLSLILNIIYFLYPNRLYLLNLIISKLFNINVNFFDKTLLYININNQITIINIGLLLLLLFIFYKFISSILEIDSKKK
ncbi:hypothetical protein BJV38_001628 [Clostridium beijerinckii]|uniref:hypothetical protein n=2 Tax=Clostridium beijerinckii TaxID=1520 RepID=UPI00156D87B7|nr:hypothetical protein [Clostridium beijerinckii]NRT35789.1 hypothetical protein [Clostridium beijerinckii]NRT44785.1 hypothetical protein [Clostridium beijerinckii]